jgi:hypothetical protein
VEVHGGLLGVLEKRGRDCPLRLPASSEDRRFLRLTDYSGPNICYFEAPTQDIERMDDLRSKKTRSSITKGYAHMTRRNNASFLLIATITLVIAGCGGQSTNDLLIGTWTTTNDGKTNVITFHADGTFGGKWETGSWGILTPTKVLISGKWSLDDKTIKYTVTKSSYMNAELSEQIVSDTVMSINDSTLVLRDETAGGEISTWVR